MTDAYTLTTDRGKVGAHKEGAAAAMAVLCESGLLSDSLDTAAERYVDLLRKESERVDCAVVCCHHSWDDLSDSEKTLARTEVSLALAALVGEDMALAIQALWAGATPTSTPRQTSDEAPRDHEAVRPMRRTVTLEDLEYLPVGTVIRAKDGWVYEKGLNGWWYTTGRESICVTDNFRSDILFEVLYDPYEKDASE